MLKKHKQQSCRLSDLPDVWHLLHFFLCVFYFFKRFALVVWIPRIKGLLHRDAPIRIPQHPSKPPICNTSCWAPIKWPKIDWVAVIKNPYLSQLNSPISEQYSGPPTIIVSPDLGQHPDSPSHSKLLNRSQDDPNSLGDFGRVYILGRKLSWGVSMTWWFEGVGSEKHWNFRRKDVHEFRDVLLAWL